MSTDGDDLARAIGGIRLRSLAAIVIGCAAVMAAVTGIVASYKALGGPVPATRTYVDERDQRLYAEVDERDQRLSAEIAELAGFARDSRIMNLNEKWWRLDAELEDIQQRLEEHPRNSMLRSQERMLKRDQQNTRKQIDQLERP